MARSDRLLTKIDYAMIALLVTWLTSLVLEWLAVHS